MFWYGEHRIKAAESETLCATDIFEKLGATGVSVA